MTDQLYTVPQAAVALGISQPRLRHLMVVRKLGHMLGRDWLLTQVEVDSLRGRKAGRPRKIQIEGEESK
jgi:hypothetical protein